MLPSSLKTIYQQYKADTDSIAAWLATTANDNGYTENVSGSHNPAAKSARKKGKSRKNGKASQQPQSGKPASKTSYVIKIRDFEPMASYVANLASVSVPEHFAVALERVIWVRKSFSDRLTACGARPNSASKDRHSYFVGVLEKVRDCLKPLMSAGVFGTSKPAAQDSKDYLKNMFNVLDVYTPSEAFLNAPDVTVPKSTTEDKYTAEQDDSLEHAIFALFALLDDYETLSKEIESLWVRYGAGSLDLAAVSVATNTAFELARSMEDETKQLLDTHGGAANLAIAYFIGICNASGIDAQDTELSGDPYNMKAYHLAKRCLANGISLLGSYANSINDHIIVNNYNGSFGWYDEMVFPSGQTNRQRWTQDSTAFFEMIPDLHFLSSNMGRGAKIEDELIRGVGPLLDEDSDDPVPLWLSFAMQTTIEVLQRFGPNCGRGFDQMKQESFRMKKAMFDIPTSSTERDKVLSVATKWDKDPIWACRETMIRQGLLPGKNPPEFKFLHRNPIHCGLLIHNMRATFHLSGVRYAAVPGGLMCTTQLYHALRHEKLLPEPAVWDDLEAFWKMQGNSAFFVGNPPTTREGYFNNYCLSIGVSASNFAPAKRKGNGKGKGKVNVNTANRRNMKFNGWVSLTMHRRLVPVDERPPLSAELLEGILVEGRRHEMMDGKGHIQPGLKEREKNEKPGAVNLSPAGLINKLASEIQAEIPLIAFDYFTMHNTAWTLLKQLKEEFTRIHGAEFLQYIPQEDKLPYVVGYTFSTAAGRKGLQDKDLAEPIDTLLNAAAEVTSEFLIKGHGRVVDDRSKAKVEPEEVADLEFRDFDPWRMEKLKSEIRKMRSTREDMDEELEARVHDCLTQ
ncbi:hypothetical protein FZEAL_5159 [Fusarium zealandicum]|uniref:DUF6604 domain-containing protein n=1 Tax=Fusarium zealandicum TaxID=1053134 RepID=A0A8H4UKE4_9HYPO|nr:hypothetical protein FZEAL_5159 [Fusarium zealandicum]